MKRINLFLIFLSILFLPVCVFAQDNNVDLIPNAKSGILIEASTGKIIYE